MAMLRCPKCGSDKLHKGGTSFHTEAGGADGKQRYKCWGDRSKCKWHGTQPVGIDEAQSQGVNPAFVQRLHERMHKTKRFVITSAQNATPVFKPFFESLLTYCKENDAQFVVIPYRYKNPTSMWSANAENDDWWAEELKPYLYNRRYLINKYLVLLGDIMTQPTANSPLQGFETISGVRSAIIGHPKLELTCIPTPQSSLPKILTTTGAVTRKNYIPAKAGKKGEHHHTFGACVIELDGKLFHNRQINATRDGTFYELAGGKVRRYSPDNVSDPDRLSGLIMGDTHEEFIDPRVEKATFGPGGIMQELRPRKRVWHDVHDFYSRNHHHRGKVFINQVKHHEGIDDVRAALEKTFAFLDRVTPEEDIENIIVNSNHPNALARWIEEGDWKSDPRNAEFYLETALAMTRGAYLSKTGAKTIDPFIYWGSKMLSTPTLMRTSFLDKEESYTIEGIECGYHGHDGPNGARGSIKGFAKIGVKTVVGHGHSPGIRDGAYQAGTNSLLQLEFVRGPSSWMHTDVAIYPNGKRTLINIVKGRYRA